MSGPATVITSIGNRSENHSSGIIHRSWRQGLVEEILQCGGVKPMLSPNLLPLEELWQVLLALGPAVVDMGALHFTTMISSLV